MKNELCTKSIPSLYRKYLIPTLISMLSNSLYCLVDVYFISKGSGSLGLAALNIAMPIYTLYSCIGLIFGVGASTIMAIAEGAGDQDLRNRAFSMSIWMMGILGAVLSIAGLVFIEPFAYGLGSSEELLPYVIAYMRPIQIATIPFILMYASSLLLRSDHNPRLAMIAMLVGNISNMVLDYVFVILLDMGISGAAIATAISPCITILISLLHMKLPQRSIHFVRNWYSFALCKRMVRNGLGSGVLDCTSGYAVHFLVVCALPLVLRLYCICFFSFSQEKSVFHLHQGMKL